MAQPVATVTLGGTDITSRVKGPEGSNPAVWGHGANFDGTGEAAGFCSIIVTNQDEAFNPRNAGSSFASVLKIGKPLRVTATHSAVTYYLFHGFVRRITPLDDGFAEIYAEDALNIYGRREVNVAPSMTRSISAFRDAILDAIGEAGGNRALDAVGAESVVVYTGADNVFALGLLNDLNRATGAVHYIHPTSSAYQYTTVDRTTLQSRASAETWSDADMANPFAERLNWFDYSDERIINEQRVDATPRQLEDDPVELWHRNRLYVDALTTKTRWARWDDPAFDLALTYDTLSGAPTVVVTPFARSAKIAVTAGAAQVALGNLNVNGRRALGVELDAGIASDATSQTAYNGVYRGNPISSDYLSSESAAEALAAWYIYRYKDPRATPGPTFVNRFPTQLAREVAERITYTASEHSLAAVECLIRSFTTRVSNYGAEWTTDYVLEEFPAAITLFTVGGSAGQGVGGSGILGY